MHSLTEARTLWRAGERAQHPVLVPAPLATRVLDVDYVVQELVIAVLVFNRGHHEDLFKFIVASDLAPKFYPGLSSFGRLNVPIRAVVAAGAGAELSA
jgi:hypothetical protein